MIKFKTGKIDQKSKQIISCILEELPDVYSDFYLTKENLRLFIRENQDLLFDLLKKGDSIVFDEEKGIIFATGFAEKRERKYIKILSKDPKAADQLLKALAWNIKTDLFIKVKKNNVILPILKKNGFIFLGSRGKETLLIRKKSTFTKKGE